MYITFYIVCAKILLSYAVCPNNTIGYIDEFNPNYTISSIDFYNNNCNSYDGKTAKHYFYTIIFNTSHTDAMLEIASNWWFTDYTSFLYMYAYDTKQTFLNMTIYNNPNSFVYNYTQEDKICIQFFIVDYNQKESWNIYFNLKYTGRFYNISLNENFPIYVHNDWYYNNNIFSVTTDYGSIEVYAAVTRYSNDFYHFDWAKFYIYGSNRMRNYVNTMDIAAFEATGSLLLGDVFSPINSTNGNMIVFLPVDNPTDITNLAIKPGYIQLIFRVPEYHAKHCASTDNFQFLAAEQEFSCNNDFDGCPQALDSDCVYTIIQPIRGHTNSDHDFVDNYMIPMLNLASMNITGSENSVKAVEGYNETYELFEFNKSTAHIFDDLTFYGNMISFITPSNSTLQLYLSSELVSYDNKPVVTFTESVFDIITIPSIDEWGFILHNNISNSYVCKDGYSKFDITIISAHLSFDAYINIMAENTPVILANQTYKNHSLTLYGNSITIKIMLDEKWYKKGDNVGFLIYFYGKYIGRPPTSTPTTREWLFAIAIGITIILIAIIIIIYIIFKKRQKRYEKLFDILKNMQISSEDLLSFKEKSDQMFIKPEKVFINFENTLGQGSCSSVYKGHLSGASPLHMATKMVETQKYCDCDVAVKVARNFGPGEVEQLYKEIQAMKMIGYHENIMCMLGWAMPGDTPCLIFDIAKFDLLHYVRQFRNFEKDEVSNKSLLSILWQVCRGMQYISSKSLVHRDLAARNILLCQNNITKISDFGLCCKVNETFTYQASVTKKLPIKWLSIEALTDHLFSEKSDVWSFGVLMYEMFTFGLIPYTTMNHDEVLIFLQEGKRLNRPESMPKELYEEVMKKCWIADPKERPSFTGLEKSLREILEKATESYGYLT